MAFDGGTRAPAAGRAGRPGRVGGAAHFHPTRAPTGARPSRPGQAPPSGFHPRANARRYGGTQAPIGNQPGAAPATAGQPPSASPQQANPFDALYWQNQAALGHQEEHAEALYGTGQGHEPLGSARVEARAAETRGLQGIQRAEVPAIQNVRNRANTEGLLESGILGARTGSVEAQFAGKRTNEIQKLQGEENRFTNALAATRERAEAGGVTDAEKALERSEAATLRAEPQTPTPAVATPPAARPAARRAPARPGRGKPSPRRAAINRAARRHR